MRERLVEIETPSGRMETFVTYPEQDGPFPAVIVDMDVWGVREELFEIARRARPTRPEARPGRMGERRSHA